MTWDASAEGSGELMAAGMKDVASLAGVAVGTVSNVLNHPDLVPVSYTHLTLPTILLV